MSWDFRSGTLDRAIYNGVVIHNEYRLPTAFAPADVVIDIGGHIGSFAQAVLSRGCGNVICVEPDPANFHIAAEYLKPHLESGCLRLERAAAWRSDPNRDRLRLDG